MASSRIEALDLRDPWIVLREHMDEAEPFISWDFPEFPAKVNYFILTGKRMPAARTISVKFLVDAARLAMTFDTTMKSIERVARLRVSDLVVWDWKECWRQPVPPPSRWMRALAYFGLAPQWR